jgi:hypothetical protein
MDKATADGTAKTIESLTKNLLECYEELDLIYRLTRRLATSLDVQKTWRWCCGRRWTYSPPIWVGSFRWGIGKFIVRD